MEGLFAPWHILVVLGVALLVLGPQQLPQAGRQVARALGELRRFREALQHETQALLNTTTENPTALDPPQRPDIDDADRSEMERSGS